MAKARWARDGENGLDLALATYMRAITFGGERIPETSFIPCAAAGSWLSRALRTSDGPCVSPRLVIDFMRSLQYWNKDSASRTFDIAHLNLYHPSGPITEPAMEFVRCLIEQPRAQPFYSRLLNPETAKQSSNIYWLLVRTAIMLHRQGHQSNARMVIDFGRRRLPTLFNPRKPPKSLKENVASGELVDQYGRPVRTAKFDRILRSKDIPGPSRPDSSVDQKGDINKRSSPII